MLDDQDIKKLKSVFATREDFNNLATKSDFDVFKSEVSSIKSEMNRGFGLMASKSDVNELKKDVEGLRESIQGMMVSVDNLAKVISDLRLEYAAISTQLTRHERWIKQIAEKVGLNLAME